MIYLCPRDGYNAPYRKDPMSRPRTYRTEALVLRHAPLGEADLLLSLLTPDQGKLRAVARGARRVTSRLVDTWNPLPGWTWRWPGGAPWT